MVDGVAALLCFDRDIIPPLFVWDLQGALFNTLTIASGLLMLLYLPQSTLSSLKYIHKLTTEH